MLQTLTENSQNSSQNNWSSSAALENSGSSTNGPSNTDDVRGQLTNTNNKAETVRDQPATQTGFEEYDPTDYIRTGERVGNKIPFLNTTNNHS